jgi:carboxymethylenebutenolidase
MSGWRAPCRLRRMSNAETAIKNLWERHLETEFAMKSPEEALATMTDDPRVTIVPTLIGGRGREELAHFYGHHFLNQLPPDLEVVPVSRTIGERRLVDELVIRFTHTIQMDWVLPGIAPTGKRIEYAMVVVVYVEDGKISVENLYWDNATILRQAGLLPNPNLPVLGAESARQVLDPTTPHNQLIR